MGRILALDIGEKRIGLAITDEGKIISQPMPYTVSPKELPNLLNELSSDYEIEEIIVGMPLSMSGNAGPQAEKFKKIFDKLKESTNIPLNYFDERLTTKQAQKLIHSGSTLPVDSLAAQQLLESYLKTK